MGKCCKCEEFKWADPRPPVWTDPVGREEFCVFHAPEEGKRGQFGEPLESNGYNALVYERIDNARKNNERCVLLGAVFPWNIDFSRFDERSPLPSISFADAKFEKGLSFTNATFSERADFHCMKSKGVAVFDHARFLADAVFCSAMFDEALFGNTKFMDRARRADFSGATFKTKAHFVNTIFNGEADFSNVTFSTNTMVETVAFSGKADFRSIKAEDRTVHIKNMEPEPLENLVFTRNDLHKLSFSDCWWPEPLGLEKFQAFNIKGFQTCEEMYRSMKQRAAEEHDQSLVSKWHYREKLMRLKRNVYDLESIQSLDVEQWKMKSLRVRAISRFKLTFKALKTLLWWYWGTSGFGERPARASVCLLALLLLPFVMNSPIGHSLWRFWYWMPDFPWLSSFVRGLGEAINASAAMQYIPFTKDIKGDGWQQVGRGLWQGAVILQFTLFALAVRNRFRR